MSRVLLFVRRVVSTPRFPDGDDTPKCVKSFGADVARGLKYIAKIEFGEWGDGSGRPDAAWLVKCPDAKTGRAIIAARDKAGPFMASTDDYLGLGRILASGTKQVAR